MRSFRKKWIAFGFATGCALASSGPVAAVTADQAFLAPFDLATESEAPGGTAGDSAQPGVFLDWVAVDSTVLDGMRGGFDVAPGLKVSFGIERLVNLNGILQTAIRIEVPDAGKLAQAQQSTGAAATPPASSNAGAPGQAITLPAATILGGGATALIQNGLANMTTSGVVSPEAAATVIQNSANNQTIQSITVINASTNSLELLKGANLQSTLLDALTQAARSR